MIYSISENTIRSSSLVNDNVESGYILQAVKVAQEVRLQQIIGSRLYERLCAMVDDGSITTYPDYKALLDGDIRNFLIYSTMAEIQPMLFGKLRNAGVVQSQDQQTQQVSLNEVHYLTEYYDTKADFFGKKIGRYLCANKSLFPEFSFSYAHGEIGASAESDTCNLNID